VVQPLRALPFTLLHGDYWEGNILRDEDGDMIVLDWLLAAIAPGVLDLVVLVTNSLWECDRLPVEPAELVAHYRQSIAASVHVAWSDDDWAVLWDHALLWRFLQEMLNWAASARPEVFARRAERFASVWLEPVLAAANRRLTHIESNR
jgi:thiamine kinase-like enzyme